MEKPNPLHHPLWRPDAIAVEEVGLMREARKRTTVATIAVFLSIAAAVYAAYQHIRAVLTPQPFVGITQSGWVFTSKPSEFRVADSELKSMWTQIIEANFARTEKGSIPGLKDFTTEDTVNGITALLARDGSSPFSVNLVIVDARIEGKATTAAELRTRGRLTIVDQKATASSEVFHSALFRRSTPTMRNPTGWMFAGLQEITREDYYEHERDAVRRELLGPKASESSAK